MKQVDSSSIEEVEYCQRERTLYIRFKHGGFYRYRNISRYMRDALVKAESVGKFFLERIKPFPEEYPYERLA